MDVFFELPSELTRNLADSWLSVVDLLVLDNAYCHKAKRERWEEVLRSADQFKNYEVPRDCSLEEYQRWMFARRIRTAKLVFQADFHYQRWYELCVNYLNDMGGYIEEVRFQDYDDEDDFETVISLVEKHCDHVVSLTCSSCLLGPVIVNLLNKSSLLHLRIRDCTDVETEYCGLTNQDGPHHIRLQTVCLRCKDSSWFVSLLLKLLKPGNIERFSVTIDDTILPSVFDNFLPFCYNLRALSFHGSDIADDDFVSLVQQCRNLLHLDISNCEYLTDDIAEAFDQYQHLSSLRTVNISSTELTSVFLEALAMRCSNSLQALYAGRGDLDTDGFRTILSDCHQLCTLECLSYKLHDDLHLAGLTTLIFWDDDDYGLEWIGRHCGKLEHLRLGFHDSDPEDYDFGELTEAVLPRLKTLEVCCEEEEEEEPESLRDLRAARPTLRVFYNTEVLAYDLFELPL